MGPDAGVDADTVVEWEIEDGIRVSNGTSSSTMMLEDGSYLMYLPGLEVATSQDGLSWDVSPLEGLTEGTFLTNPAVIRIDDEFVLIYEIDADGVRRLYRAVSNNGLDFARTDGVEDDGAVLAPENGDNDFLSVPDLILLDEGELRMYFVAGGDHIETATSGDKGLSFAREGPITIDGLEDGRSRVDPDIIRLDNGQYRLFFSAPPPDQEFANLRILSALSDEGRNFVLEPGERISVETDEQLRLDPDVVRYEGDHYRMYFGEAASVEDLLQLRSAVTTM